MAWYSHFMDTAFGKANPVDASKAIGAATAENAHVFDVNKGAAGQTGPYGSSTYGPNGVVTSYGGSVTDPNSAAGINAGLLKNAGTYTAAGGNLPNYGGINYAKDIADQQYAAAEAYWKPDEARQRAALEQQLANRGIPLGGGAGTIYGDTTGQMYDAQNRAHVAAAAAAAASVPGLQGLLIQNQNTMAEEPGKLASGELGRLGQFAGLLPHAGDVRLGATDVGGITAQYDKMNMDAAAARRAGIGQAIQTGVAFAGAPFTGGASLSMLPGGGNRGNAQGGGGGLFNGYSGWNPWGAQPGQQLPWQQPGYVNNTWNSPPPGGYGGYTG